MVSTLLNLKTDEIKEADMTRFEKHSTFAQKLCREKYNHSAILVKDLTAKIGPKSQVKTMTVAYCMQCGYLFVTTHYRLKRLLKTHELRE